jgi:membrane associated rhomboid family serine protease
MDWSLALVSQGIESVIDHSDEAGWGLIVRSGEYQRAVDVIQQYRAENLRWPWRRPIQQKLLFDWGSLAWVFLISLSFWCSERLAVFGSAGLMDGKAVSRGQWWRLFTAVFLHADAAHLVANAVFGFVLLGLAMGVYGSGTGLLAALLAGVGGNALALLIDPAHRSLGASGMVMGCLGLLVVQPVSIWRKNPWAFRSTLIGIAAGGMLFLLLGSGPGTDLAAHLGGFISGIVLGIILRFSRACPPDPATDLVAGGIFSLLVIVTWWLALTSGG